MAELSKEEKLARLKLSRCESVGPTTFWALLEKYHSAEKALSALKRAGKTLYGNEQLSREIDLMTKIGGRFIFPEDALFPPLLKNIPDCPPVLSFLGNKNKVLSMYRKNIISVVGARNASIHSCKFCEILSTELSKRGVVIVSGLARGIDTAAHKASLQNGTIAVIACGINIAYPQENEALYKKIVEQGGIFSEMPIDTPPQPKLFPRRNRLIAGMSFGTLVVEAAEKSGSLITAKMALEYGRDVFAVPGFPMDPRSAGGNALLKSGAILVQSSQDILDHFTEQIEIPTRHQSVASKISAENLEIIKEKIVNSLSTVPITIDELISSIKVSPQGVLSALLELELTDKVVRLHGQRICLSLNC